MVRKRPNAIHQTAFNFAAPHGERFDAQSELMKAHKPLSSMLIPRSDVQEAIDYINTMWEEQHLVKAQGANIKVPGKPRQRGMQSVYLDDRQIFAHGEYWEKPSAISFDTLRAMVDGTPVLASVIFRRVRQVSRFCAPQESEDTPGFEIRHIDKSHQVTASEKRSLQLLTRFIQNCGWEFKPRLRQRLKRDAFPAFISKLVRDSLAMDSAAIELEWKRDKARGIDGFYAMDGATIRLCTEEGYQGDDEIFSVQAIEGQVRTIYTRDDLIYVPRNPRTDVRLAGYGLSETELLVRVVTGFLNAMTYNIKGFDDNSIPKGVMHLVGNYDNNDLASFKRYWNAMVKGINNAWTVPVLVSKDQESAAHFEKFGIEFDEMYFSKWMTFLVSIICAIYGMDPAEVNFESFASTRAPLSGSDTEERLASAKDDGLRPLMSYMESLITDYIVAEFSENYVFRWAGLDPEDKDKRHEMRKLICNVNEARAEQGLDAWDGPLGEAPLNASLVSVWLQMQQQANQDFGQEDGAPGGGGQGDGEADGGADGQQQDGREGDFGKQGNAGGKPGGEESAPPGREGDFGKSFIYTVE